MDIICLGDSITHASAFAESDRWPTVLKTKLNLKPYNQTVGDVANKVHAPIIDFPEIIKTKNINLHEFLDEDGVHLTINGNHTYAQIVFDRLLEILE